MIACCETDDDAEVDGGCCGWTDVDNINAALPTNIGNSRLRIMSRTLGSIIDAHCLGVYDSRTPVPFLLKHPHRWQDPFSPRSFGHTAWFVSISASRHNPCQVRKGEKHGSYRRLRNRE